MGLNLAPLGKKLNEYAGDVGRFFGGVADAVVPGDQSNWHQPAAPTQQPQARPAVSLAQPQQQAAANIGQSLGYGPNPIPSMADAAMASMKPKVAVKKPQTLADQTKQLAAMNAAAPQPDASQGGYTKPGNPILGTVEAIAKPLLDMRQANMDQTLAGLNGVKVARDPATGQPVRNGNSKMVVDPNSVEAVSSLASNFVGGLKMGGKPPVKMVDTPAGKVTLSPRDWPTDGLPGPDTPPVGRPPISDEARAATAAANPHQVAIPEVVPGDHAQAIANSQKLSNPVQTASSLWESTMRDLRKQSPDEYQNFWRSVEDPSSASHSPLLQKAIGAWRQGSDIAHAGATALGKEVGYVNDYARHPWDLTGWAEAEKGVPGSGGEGVFTTKPRIHQTIAEGEATGLKLGTDPLAEGKSYFGAAASQLRKDALVKGFSEADANATARPHTLDLGYGKTVQLSDEGMAAAKGTAFSRGSQKMVVKGLRATNKTVKSTLLSMSQFHTINIGGLRAAPALILRGHPVAAAKGVYGMLRGAFGHQYADRVIGHALEDGTVEKAAQVGMPYGSSEYSDGLKLVGIGEHTVFGKQMPMMHDQVVRSILTDLEKKGVPLDSPQARAAGKAGNNMMGFVNKEAQKVGPVQRRAMNDWLLAGQFTPAKFGSLRDTARGGVAGKYARATVAGNVAALTAVAAGIGFIGQQKSDDIRDLLLRSLLDPSAPSSETDAKGNTLKYRLPGSNVSDVTKLVGMKLVRGNDGHLTVDWRPGNMPQTVEDFLRARLSPLGSAGVKILTNVTFAGKPLYDPNAPLGTKAQQAATSLVVGNLPIGTQGLAYTDTVKNAMPGDIKDVLNAQTPGTNPILKSIGSSFGLTPATDQTVGKGKDSAQYFDARAQARGSLDKNDKAVFDAIHPDTKNPVTGKYQTSPTVWDGQTRASDYLSHPNVLAADNKLNQQLATNGQKIDPFFKLPADQQSKFLTYSTLNQNDPQKTRIEGDNPWMRPFQNERSDFFAQLPPGDPNKPKSPVAYPTPDTATAAIQDQYFKLTDSKQKADFIKANPALVDQFAKEDNYNRTVRGIKNLPQYDKYPTADAGTQKILDTYNALPKSKSGGNTGADSGARSAWIKANPAAYAKMTGFLLQTSLYGLEKSAGQAAFESQGFDQKGLKDISSVARDINQSVDANGNTIYSLTANGSGSSTSKFKSSSSGGSGGGGSFLIRQAKQGKFDTKLGHDDFKKVSSKRKGMKVASKGAGGKPKVSLKASKA